MSYEEAKAKISIRSIYRHYKGDWYEVMAIAKDAETKEPIVIYQDISNRAFFWTRPASMWFDEVDNGVKRFELYQKFEFELY